MSTEKEKMLAGKPYDARDPELLAMYHRARKLTSTYNTTLSSEEAEREALLRELLGGIGKGVWIDVPFYCDYGENITIGNDVFINNNCIMLDCSRITIGDNVLIGPAVQLYTATHSVHVQERIVPSDTDPSATKYIDLAMPITIGSNVWLGGGVIVVAGVEIGRNTTIGAGAVVTKSVPADVFAAGNPCRVIRTLS